MATDHVSLWLKGLAVGGKQGKRGVQGGAGRSVRSSRRVFKLRDPLVYAQAARSGL